MADGRIVKPPAARLECARMADRPVLDETRQSRAREYGSLRRRVGLLQMGLSLAFLAAWVASGISSGVIRAAAALEPAWPIPLLAVGGSVSVAWSLIAAPLGFYAGYVLPHRYRQSTQTLRLWITDRAKNLAIGLLLGVPVLLGLYGAMRAWPEAWWLAAAIGQVGFVLLLSLAAPVLLMPMFYRFRPLREEHAELADRLTRLSEAAGQRVRGVFAFDMSRRTRAANAMLVGLGRTRRIVLGDTLLDEFPPDEVEAILAHELGHHAHRDIPAGVLLQGLLTAAWLWLTGGVLDLATDLRLISSAVDPAGLPLVMLTMTALGTIGAPVLNAYSRWRERRADAFSLKLTGRPQAFADAMTRLANQNLAEANPPAWAVTWFGTHPPLAERIEAATGITPPPGSPLED